MPPRYAYWTILVDDQPTAFRAGAKEDLLPTFNRLKEKHASATMMWFQNGKLWPSRLDAQEAMRARGEMGRRGDSRQAGGFRDRPSGPRARRPASPGRSERPEWTPKPASPQARKPSGSDSLEWKPKGAFTPPPKRSDRPERSEWKPKGSFDRDRKPGWSAKPASPQTRKPSESDWKPKGSFERDRKPGWSAKPASPQARKPSESDWKPKGSFDRDRKPGWSAKPASPQARKPSESDWKPKGSFDRKPEWKPRTSGSDKLEWKPKTESGTRSSEPATRAKRAWIPKEEYKKSKGIEAKRDSKWRPGGEHRDPRQKYKDAKKAKWSRFKQNIRQKWDKKRGPKKDDDK